MCICSPHAQLVPVKARSGNWILRLELQMVVNCYKNAKNALPLEAQSASVLKLWVISPAPIHPLNCVLVQLLNKCQGI